MTEPDNSTLAFSLGEILSITTGVLLCRMDGIYRLLDYMTGDTLYTHQLPRAADECAPALLGQHPDLAGVSPPRFDDEEDVFRWLAEQTRRYGETREVRALTPEDHTRVDPIAEWHMRSPGTPVITVEVDGD